MDDDNGIRYQLADHERRLQKAEDRLESVPVMDERLAALTKEVRSMKAALIAVAVSFVGGSAMLLLSILELSR